MIHGCMKSIPAATPITLTKEEHAELEPFDEDGTPAATAGEDCAAFGGGPGDARNRPRGRLHDGHGVEMAGTPRRAAAGRRRRPGLDAPGDRGNEPKYTDAPDKRLLAVLARPIPAGLRALEWAAKALG